MKKSILLSFIFCVIQIGYSQEANYNEVSNKKIKGAVTEYTGKLGEVLKIGDTLVLGKPTKENNYYFIVQNLGLGSTAIVGHNAIGKEVQIKNMKSKQGKMIIYTSAPDGYVAGLMVIDSDLATEQGELKSSMMSSDEALEELKKWKDKLDLELISKEEYEAKKKELVPFIK